MCGVNALVVNFCFLNCAIGLPYNKRRGKGESDQDYAVDERDFTA